MRNCQNTCDSAWYQCCCFKKMRNIPTRFWFLSARIKIMIIWHIGLLILNVTILKTSLESKNIYVSQLHYAVFFYNRSMIFPILSLIFGLVILIGWADILVRGASSLAKKLGISSLVIGLTIVAFGTSMPELIVSLLASIQWDSDIALGNVVGSNIANILLILWITSLLGLIPVARSTVSKEIPFSILAVLALWFLGADAYFGQGANNVLSRGDGAVLLLFFAIFLYYVYTISRSEDNDDTGIKKYSVWLSTILILGWLVGLFLWGKMFVDGAVLIAQSFGVSEMVIGLTIVAIGTSLPELVTSIIAARKWHNDIAVWNIVWSNIFNIFWILGFSSTITPIRILDTISFIDIVICFATSCFLFFALFVGKKHTLERWQWIIFVLLYVLYTWYLLVR